MGDEDEKLGFETKCGDPSHPPARPGVRRQLLVSGSHLLVAPRRQRMPPPFRVTDASTYSVHETCQFAGHYT
jgi:hypothetical protein